MWCVLVFPDEEGQSLWGCSQPASRAPTGSCRGSRVGPCLGAIGGGPGAMGLRDLTLQAAEQNARRQVADLQACAWILLRCALIALCSSLSSGCRACVCFCHHWLRGALLSSLLLLPWLHTHFLCWQKQMPISHIVALSQFSQIFHSPTAPCYPKVLSSLLFPTLPRSLQQRGLSCCV